ncbi:hypothetical protein ECDEC2B_0340 [Escherichia coli DEC2B]|nr:hypothetical protein ECDEC2B_0340 [Escherichia coli DEC2B]
MKEYGNAWINIICVIGFIVNEMMELRQQVMEGQIGGFLLGGAVSYTQIPTRGFVMSVSLL